jgi:hypothetical protein
MPERTSPEKRFEARGGLMAGTQYEELRVPPEPGAQRRVFAANFTFAANRSAIEPEVGLAIELILQVVRERLIGRSVTGAGHTIASTSGDAA